MRRLEALIAQSRRATENQDLTGIGNDEFVQYYNDAQDRLQSKIQQEHPEQDYWANVGYITLNSTTDVYSLVDLEDENGTSFKSQILASSAVSLVERSELSTFSNSESYVALKYISPNERRTGWGYFFRGRDIIIAPKPQTGKVRITFTKRLTNLDIRRGKVGVISPGSYLQLAAGTVPQGTDFANIDYCCVIDGDGTIILGEIPVSSYNQGSRRIFTSSTLTGVTTDHYVVYGKYATTHSGLDDIAERYLIEYCNMRIFMRDSSNDIRFQSALVNDLEKEIIGLYAEPGNDAKYIPILETDYLNY